MVLIILKIAYKKDVYDNIKFLCCIGVITIFPRSSAHLCTNAKKIVFWGSGL